MGAGLARWAPGVLLFGGIMGTTAIRAALVAFALSALGVIGCGGNASTNNGNQGGTGAQGGEGGAGAQGGAGGAQGGEGGAQGGAGGAQGGEGGVGQGGSGGGGVCDPQEVKGVGDCNLILGVAWDGQSCVEIGGCECIGADCDALYDSGEACKVDHAGCSTPGGPCDPEKAMGVGDCDAFFGYAWNGAECVGISGCNCEGPACAGLSMDLAVCEEKHAGCSSMGAKCDPQKAEGVGPCAAIVGYKWDGLMCVAISGCSCEGPGCADLYDSGDACAAAHADCPPPSNCPPQEAKGEGACDLFLGWVWNGSMCIPLSGCSCIGSDCVNLSDSPEVCQMNFSSCQ
jgi:hypothetical protein